MADDSGRLSPLPAPIAEYRWRRRSQGNVAGLWSVFTGFVALFLFWTLVPSLAAVLFGIIGIRHALKLPLITTPRRVVELVLPVMGLVLGIVTLVTCTDFWLTYLQLGNLFD